MSIKVNANTVLAAQLKAVYQLKIVLEDITSVVKVKSGEWIVTYSK